MTRIEHHIRCDAAVTCGPAGPPGTHEIRVEDGPVTVVLRFGSAQEMAGFATTPYAYALTQARPSGSGVDGATTGVWGQGSAGEPVVLSGEGGNAATTQAPPADPIEYHPDPQINAEVAADVADAESADLAAGYSPRAWKCPCGAVHRRGYFDLARTHRCLGCGYVGTGGILLDPGTIELGDSMSQPQSTQDGDTRKTDQAVHQLVCRIREGLAFGQPIGDLLDGDDLRRVLDAYERARAVLALTEGGGT